METEEKEPAGFWVRGGAVFVDFVVAGAMGGLLGLTLFKMHVPFIPRILCGLFLGAAYRIGMTGRWGQTVGKMAAGIVVVAEDGSPVGYGRATGRFFASYLSAAIMDGGYLMAAWTKRNHALHDYMAGTRVIYKPNVSAGRRIALTVAGVFYPIIMVGVGAFIGWKVVVPVIGASAAIKLEKDGKYELAEKQFDNMVKLYPKNALWWNGRCWERAIIGKDLEGALADCDQSLRLKTLPDTFDSRGLVLLKMKRYAESVASYDEALKGRPGIATAFYGRGLARIALGDRPGGEADLKEATLIKPAIVEDFRKYGLPPADR
jgi:uncharacterized RDD family membrane protein YckC